jgi:hypothetical protein
MQIERESSLAPGRGLDGSKKRRMRTAAADAGNPSFRSRRAFIEAQLPARLLRVDIGHDVEVEEVRGAAYGQRAAAAAMVLCRVGRRLLELLGRFRLEPLDSRLARADRAAALACHAAASPARAPSE